ncbi:MAG TPA: hypothetical protein VFK44_09255 [Bacillales bacterium]|nr:hypothetical protein [Bacillales bacterium]
MVGLGLMILFVIVGAIIFYILIETAVRRGIDSSDTNLLLKKWYEEQQKKPNEKENSP